MLRLFTQHLACLGPTWSSEMKLCHIADFRPSEASTVESGLCTCSCRHAPSLASQYETVCVVGHEPRTDGRSCKHKPILPSIFSWFLLEHKRNVLDAARQTSTKEEVDASRGTECFLVALPRSCLGPCSRISIPCSRLIE